MNRLTGSEGRFNWVVSLFSPLLDGGQYWLLAVSGSDYGLIRSLSGLV